MKLIKNKFITKDDILEHVSEYDIYRYYFGEFKLNQVTNNHLRGELTPSFIIGNKGTGLSHFDFGDKYWRGNCFTLVQQIKYCNFDTALRTIDRDFGLGLFEKTLLKTKNIITWEEPVDAKVSKTPLIQVITRKIFNLKELEYWEDFGQGKDDLKSENVFAPKQIFINGIRKKFYENELTFCYFSPEIEKWKIYCPHSPSISFMKEGKEIIIPKKWYSNIPFDYIEHLETLKNDKPVFIAKSRKDRMVLKKALQTNSIIVTQAEDPCCFTNDTIKTIINNSNTQITCFDSDKKGKESSQWLTDNYNFKYCNVPDKYIKKNINDFAALAARYGLKRVTDHFKKKKMI